jgi:low affinity Fe/Cu permease
MAKKPDSESKTSWATIIASVKTTFGLIALMLLVLDSVAVVISLNNPQFLGWALAVIALTVVLIFTVVFLQPAALYHPDDLRYVTIS